MLGNILLFYIFNSVLIFSDSIAIYEISNQREDNLVSGPMTGGDSTYEAIWRTSTFVSYLLAPIVASSLIN